MAKIITKKSQIPEYAQKKIKNFKKLTDNQAIFEYELFKLQRRAKRSGVKLPPIFRPKKVTKEAIKEVAEIRGSKLKQFEKKEIPIDEPADALEQARAFLEAVKEEIINDRDSAIVSYSSYRSGRTRTAKSRSWITDNINRAANMLLNLLNSITSSDEQMLAFAKRFMENDTELANLQDAIKEYIMNSYSVIDTSSYLNSSEVYRILVGRPLTLQESKNLSDNDEGYEDEE